MRNIITIALLVGCVFLGKAQNEADKWLKAVSAQQGIAIEWQERPTSFAKKGIKSFVGYYKGDFVASLSVGKSVSGSFNYQGTSYEICDSKGQLVFYKSEQGICGNEDKEPHRHSAFARPVLAAEEAQPKIANTQVLRVYQLAMHIPYSTFITSHFEEKVEKVKAFWANTEAFLNEMYMRDLGVRFEVVNDERLIIKDENQETFARTRDASYVKDNSTIVINKLIGENSYDVGISLVFTSSQKSHIRGLAYFEGVYQPNTKADAVAVLTKEVIAHEIGHLFGGRHTFGSHKGSAAYDSEKTELDSGTSVMSYGSPRDFFSLSSIERIRQRLTQVPAKAKDKTFATQAPRIDRSKLKSHYTIPKGTFFQFYIPATDPDSEQLLYTVNQHDVRNGDETPITQYAIYKPTTANPVTIKTEYHENSGNVVANSGLAHQTTGTFTFWLGVSDAQPQQAADYIVQYDLAETKVTVKEGTPFEITTTPKNKYKGGEKISLQWNVDAAIFAGTKVRVLLSDDLGKTFKHIVLAETANDGAEEVTLPNINTSKAVLKIEVIDGLAFALTNYHPQTGGFTIEKDDNLASEPLAFVATTLPQDLNLSCAKEMPTAVMPITTGGCASVSYRMEEKKTAVLCDNRFTLLRIFTATDGCTTLTHTQTIKVADNIPPTFVGTLPQDIAIEEGNVTPTQVVLTATDNCGSASVSTTQQTVKQNGKVSKLLYIWKAKDACGNQAVYTQTIIFTPKAATPPLAFVATTLPQDLNLSCAKEVPTVVMPTTTGGCASVSYRMEEKKTAVLCDNRFTLLRIFTATDGCTTLTHTQTIKVADNIPPTFVGTLPQDITIEEGNITPTQVVLTAADNCGSASVSSTQQTVKQNGKVSKLLYIWKAKDACGNQAVYTQTIIFTPKAATPPLAFVATTLPQDLNLSCAKEVPTVVMPTTTGGCASVSYRMEEKKTAVLCDNRFTLLRIFTATDGCTTLTHTQTIKVADNIPPTFVGTLPQDIAIEEGNVTPTQVVLTATDNCGSASVSTTQQTVKQNGKVSKLLYIWKAKDACGNQAVYTQTIIFTPKAATPPLAFVATTLPQDLNLSCAKEVPTVVMPTTTGGCASVSYRMEEKKTAVLCDNRFTLLRIFTVTDGCATLTHTQTIKVADNIPPTFVGTLPQDITIEEGDPIPLQKSISAEDTCAGAPTVKRSMREELNEEGKRVKIIYQWVARDVCGNEAVHTQTISITPKKVVPPASNDTAEVVIYNGVSTDDANNYFRIANTDPNSPISVIIFDEMGLKVYESDHYQERGEVFRGYPNVKSVIGSNKALAGTYFYIVKYYKNGKQESAKGFLYVR